MGLLKEMVKSHSVADPEYEQSRVIPIAACIFIAFELNMTEKLQAIFGEIFTTKAVQEKWGTKLPISLWGNLIHFLDLN